MKVNFPTRYNVEYPIKNKKFYNWNNQHEIKKVLTKSSKEYCMYCGNRIVINNKNFGQLEHSVDKTQNSKEIKYLEHCKFNIAIACSICNTSLKKETLSISSIKDGHVCSNQCEEVCSTYRENMVEYINKNHIIIMPNGVVGEETSELYGIEYDLLRMRFHASENNKYNENDKCIIENHISRFKMNCEQYMPLDVIKVCEFVVKYGDIPEKNMFNNIMAEIFIDFLNHNCKDEKAVMKVCELIIIMATL